MILFRLPFLTADHRSPRKSNRDGFGPSEKNFSQNIQETKLERQFAEKNYKGM